MKLMLRTMYEAEQLLAFPQRSTSSFSDIMAVSVPYISSSKRL
jgi:hypothetical protein